MQNNENNDSKDLLPAISDDKLLSMAEQAEKRVAAMNKIKIISLSLTNLNDWVDQNGKPYLQVSGAEKIARMFGISWSIDDPTKEDLGGGHYIYTYKGMFEAYGATIEAVGSRSSKDGFFKRYDYSTGQKLEMPASEIDPGDVKKAAYTNCVGNGITRLLGLRNLTWEEVEQHGGFKRGQASKVEYKSPIKKEQDKPINKEPEDDNRASQPQRRKLYAMCKQRGLTDDSIAAFNDFLKETYKEEHLSKKSMSDIFENFDSAITAFIEEFGNEEKE